jgi:hypothetical protein
MATMALPGRAIRSIRTNTIGRVTALWSALVLGVLTWQSVTYRGLVARAAEWQFAAFGTYFPIATVFWLLVLFTLPLVVLLVWRVGRRRKQLETRQLDAAALLEAARATSKLLIGLAAAGLIVAGVLLIAAASIRGGTPRVFALLPNAIAPRVEGPVRIHGTLRLNRLAEYRPAMIVPMRPTYFAPLTANDAAGPVLQYFAAVGETAASAAKPVDMQGVSVASALPGSVRQLYLNAGYGVSDHTYVIYPDIGAARRRYTDALTFPLAFALAFGLIALIQHRSVRRLKIAAGQP